MNDVTRINVPLSKDEFIALRDVALKEYRHPRDHARYLLRMALGLAEEPATNKHNRADAVLADGGAVVA